MGKLGLGCVAVLVIVVVIVGISFAGTYNRLVTLGQDVDKQWSEVENQYQRRADLVPNLVATVQGAAQFEKGTLRPSTGPRLGRARARSTPGTAPDGSGAARPVRAGPGPARRGAAAAPRRRRAISGAEGEPELPRPPGAARRNGEPDRGRRGRLQQVGPGLQHRAAAVPDEPHGGDARASRRSRTSRRRRRAPSRRRRCSSTSAARRRRRPRSSRDGTGNGKRQSGKRARESRVSLASSGWLFCGSLAALAALLLADRRRGRQLPPKPTRYVTDRAGVLRPAAPRRSTRSSSSSSGTRPTRSSSGSTGRSRRASRSRTSRSRAAQKWGAGQAGKNNGAVLFVFTEDRKVRIEVGYGLEGALPDVTAQPDHRGGDRAALPRRATTPAESRRASTR